MVMIEKIKSEDADFLIKAFMSLETAEEYYRFLDDICTVAEIREMSKRLKAAKMLKSKAVYSDVAKATGLSTATISRVSRCLKYGSDGYGIALDRIAGGVKAEKTDGQK